jgi:hypothetical protein
VQIQPGDIVVVGTDGIFDNLSTYRIKEAVKKALIDETLLTTLP